MKDPVLLRKVEGSADVREVWKEQCFRILQCIVCCVIFWICICDDLQCELFRSPACAGLRIIGKVRGLHGCDRSAGGSIFWF